MYSKPYVCVMVEKCVKSNGTQDSIEDEDECEFGCEPCICYLHGKLLAH